MAFIRSCMLLASTFILYFNIAAQTVYYPLQASSLLKSTAADAADLLKKQFQAMHLPLNHTASYQLQVSFLFMILPLPVIKLAK